MESELTVDKRLFLPIYQVEYRAEIELSPADASTVLHTCLQHILPPSVFSGEPIEDYKGRDKNTVLLKDFPPAALPLGDEFAFISGELFLSEEDLEERAQHAPFTVRIGSEFKEFLGSHHIVYQGTTTASDLLPDELLPQLLGYVAPLTIQTFRIGLERFESRMSFAALGYSPVVIDRIAVDYHNGKLVLLLACDEYRKGHPLPFSGSGELAVIDSCLSKISKAQLVQDFSEKLTRSLF